MVGLCGWSSKQSPHITFWSFCLLNLLLSHRPPPRPPTLPLLVEIWWSGCYGLLPRFLHDQNTHSSSCQTHSMHLTTDCLESKKAWFSCFNLGQLWGTISALELPVELRHQLWLYHSSISSFAQTCSPNSLQVCSCGYSPVKRLTQITTSESISWETWPRQLILWALQASRM